MKCKADGGECGAGGYCDECPALPPECEASPDGKHWRRWVKDWMGDPTIPYGTKDCSHFECAHCGEELGDER